MVATRRFRGEFVGDAEVQVERFAVLEGGVGLPPMSTVVRRPAQLAAAELAANMRAKLDASFIMAVLNTSTGIADAAQRAGDVGLGALSAWPRCSC
jgi:hypothetical protein